MANVFDFSGIPSIANWSAEYTRTTGKTAEVVTCGNGWYAIVIDDFGRVGKKMRLKDFDAAAARLKTRAEAVAKN